MDIRQLNRNQTKIVFHGVDSLIVRDTPTIFTGTSVIPERRVTRFLYAALIFPLYVKEESNRRNGLCRFDSDPRLH